MGTNANFVKHGRRVGGRSATRAVVAGTRSTVAGLRRTRSAGRAMRSAGRTIYPSDLAASRSLNMRRAKARAFDAASPAWRIAASKKRRRVRGRFA